jgi:hypothetical protein
MIGEAAMEGARLAIMGLSAAVALFSAGVSLSAFRLSRRLHEERLGQDRERDRLARRSALYQALVVGPVVDAMKDVMLHAPELLDTHLGELHRARAEGRDPAALLQAFVQAWSQEVRSLHWRVQVGAAANADEALRTGLASVTRDLEDAFAKRIGTWTTDPAATLDRSAFGPLLEQHLMKLAELLAMHDPQLLAGPPPARPQ